MFESNWSESTRGKALWLGLPSILLAVLGLALLCWAQFGMAGSLEDGYRSRAEKSSEKRKALKKELDRELRMLRASQGALPGEAGKAVIPKDDPRRIELETLLNEESIYLQKLITLDQENPEYHFDLAMVAGERGDLQRQAAIIKKISPLDEPGYVDGHIWLAQRFLTARVKDRGEKFKSLSRALQHADQCLRREKDHKLAKQIKAHLLVQFGELNEAYDVFLDLFKDDPVHIDSLYDINERTQQQQRNSSILDEAIIRFSSTLEQDELSDSERSKVWRSLIGCYQRKKDFESAEQELLDEIKLQSEMENGEGKRVWAERLLARVYLARISAIDNDDPQSMSQRLGWLKKAYRFDPTNSVVLQGLVQLSGSSDTAVANEARQIYYPTSFSTTPAAVLNELGTQALAKSEYQAALQFFELAKRKAPRNPVYLNNLAYTYLVGDSPNPKRALKLIDEAIRFLPANTPNLNLRKSSFHDTKGHAMMQLNRMTDAVLEFEMALRERPDNRRILEALIQCCESAGINPSAYINRLKLLDQRDARTPKPSQPNFADPNQIPSPTANQNQTPATNTDGQ